MRPDLGQHDMPADKGGDQREEDRRAGPGERGRARQEQQGDGQRHMPRQQQDRQPLPAEPLHAVHEGRQHREMDHIGQQKGDPGHLQPQQGQAEPDHRQEQRVELQLHVEEYPDRAAATKAKPSDHAASLNTLPTVCHCSSVAAGANSGE